MHLLRAAGKPPIDDEEVGARDFPHGDASVHQSRARADWMRENRSAISGFHRLFEMAR